MRLSLVFITYKLILHIFWISSGRKKIPLDSGQNKKGKAPLWGALAVCCSLLVPLHGSMAKNIVDQIGSPLSQQQVKGPGDLSIETLKKISPSRRIFIISNERASFFKGDFISLLLNDHLVARALVAKIVGEEAGIKIMKVYSIKHWETLRIGMDVQVLRGDDSYFRLDDPEAQQASTLLAEEEDLFNETLLEEDSQLDRDSLRVIKPDNMFFINLSQITVLDINEGPVGILHFSGGWSYQMAENIWAELSYGQGAQRGFPSAVLNTSYQSLSVRLKYTVSFPWHSYLLPYFGYMRLIPTSIGAGNVPDEQESNEEIQLLNSSVRNEVILGITILRRFVPGWFFRADVGSDVIGGGLALEF